MTEEKKEKENNSNRFTNGLIIAEWATLATLFFGSFYFMQTQIQAQTIRTDALHKQFQEAMQAQSNRTDDLHREFIDLLKNLIEERKRAG